MTILRSRSLVWRVIIIPTFLLCLSPALHIEGQGRSVRGVEKKAGAYTASSCANPFTSTCPYIWAAFVGFLGEIVPFFYRKSCINFKCIWTGIAYFPPPPLNQDPMPGYQFVVHFWSESPIFIFTIPCLFASWFSSILFPSCNPENYSSQEQIIVSCQCLNKLILRPSGWWWPFDHCRYARVTPVKQKTYLLDTEENQLSAEGWETSTTYRGSLKHNLHHQPLRPYKKKKRKEKNAPLLILQSSDRASFLSHICQPPLQNKKKGRRKDKRRKMGKNKQTSQRKNHHHTWPAW